MKQMYLCSGVAMDYGNVGYAGKILMAYSEAEAVGLMLDKLRKDYPNRNYDAAALLITQDTIDWLRKEAQ